MKEKHMISAMKFADWPSLDRDLWLNVRVEDPCAEEVNPATDWRPTTLKNVERGYGAWLTWLTNQGLINEDFSPMERVRKEHIQAFIKDFSIGRSEHTVAGAMRDIAYFFRAVAHPGGIDWLSKTAYRMSNSAKPSKPKLPRMAPIAELAALGRDMMHDGRTEILAGKRSGAPIYRDGLMIAALATRPELRRKNFAALRLGSSLAITASKVTVRFEGEETKTRQEADFAFPAWLVPSFATYIKEVRPILLGGKNKPDEGWLWISRRGRRLADNYVTIRLTKATMAGVGHCVSPHLFRDCAATDIALYDSAHVGITKHILGHTTLATSQAHYNQAASFTAMRRYGNLLEALMDDEEEVEK